jgi:hypothetical protein
MGCLSKSNTAPAKYNKSLHELFTENSPPTVSVNVAPLYCVGDWVEIQIKGSDPEGDVLNYQIVNPTDPLPDGLSLNNSTGLISGKLALNQGVGSSTNYAVNVRVADFFGASTHITINLFVISTCGARVGGFSLIDASNNTSLGPLHDGDVIDLSLLPSNLSIRANANPGEEDVNSVVFDFNGKNNFRTENIEPYALGGDRSGDYSSMLLPLGTNKLTATPYSLSDGKGTSGMPLSVMFTVVKTTGNHPPSLSTGSEESVPCRGDHIEISLVGKDPDNDPLVYSIDPRGDRLPDHLSIDPKTGLISGLLVKTGDEGSSTFYDLLVKATDPGGLFAYTVVHLFSIDCGLRVSSFTLVDAATDKDIMRLRSGDILNLQQLPSQLTIRADVYPEESVKSVVFDLNGKNRYRTEKLTPFALGGDNNGDYNSVPIKQGLNTVTATPFYDTDATQRDNQSFTLNFYVSANVLPGLTNKNKTEGERVAHFELTYQQIQLTAFPNPFASQLQVRLSKNLATPLRVTLQLHNTDGQLVFSRQLSVHSGIRQFDVAVPSLPKGIYWLQVLNNEKPVTKPVKLYHR